MYLIGSMLVMFIILLGLIFGIGLPVLAAVLVYKDAKKRVEMCIRDRSSGAGSDFIERNRLRSSDLRENPAEVYRRKPRGLRRCIVRRRCAEINNRNPVPKIIRPVNMAKRK